MKTYRSYAFSIVVCATKERQKVSEQVCISAIAWRENVLFRQDAPGIYLDCRGGPPGWCEHWLLLQDTKVLSHHPRGG